MNGNSMVMFVTLTRANQLGLSGSDALKAMLLGQNIGKGNMAMTIFATELFIKKQVSAISADKSSALALSVSETKPVEVVSSEPVVQESAAPRKSSRTAAKAKDRVSKK